MGLITTFSFWWEMFYLICPKHPGIICEILLWVQPPWVLGSQLNSTDSPLMVLYWPFSSAFTWSHLGPTVSGIFARMNQRCVRWHHIGPSDEAWRASGWGPVLVLFAWSSTLCTSAPGYRLWLTLTCKVSSFMSKWSKWYLMQIRW